MPPRSLCLVIKICACLLKHWSTEARQKQGAINLAICHYYYLDDTTFFGCFQATFVWLWHHSFIAVLAATIIMSWNNGDLVVIEDDDLVSHVIGSSGQRGNWKQFWCAHTARQWPSRCSIQRCGNDAEVGAHMYIKGSHQTFIVPTCQTCNKDGICDYPNWVSVNNSVVAVRVEQHEGIYNSDGGRR